jgi:hypothetical protein
VRDCCVVLWDVGPRWESGARRVQRGGLTGAQRRELRSCPDSRVRGHLKCETAQNGKTWPLLSDWWGPPNFKLTFSLSE